jgi:tRNA G10  N-methylase Trm11
VAVIAPIVEQEAKHLGRPMRLLDPFAGVGGVHTLSSESALGQGDLWETMTSRIATVGIELEPEWACHHARTMVGDARALPFSDATFDIVVTSPTYGNRMADHHNAKDGSRRITYTHNLGRTLTPGNSGAMQWGEDYRQFHRLSLGEVERVLPIGRLFVLNVSNHIRMGKEVPVVQWHRDTLLAMGFTMERDIEVPTARLRYGANHASRVAWEHVMCLRRG